MSANELEQHLMQPIPLAGDIEQAAQRLKQDTEVMGAVVEADKSTRDLYSNVKNPETHSPLGILGSYLGYKALKSGIDRLKERIGNFYRVKINGNEIRLTYENTVRFFEYRLNQAKEAISGLVKVYRREISELPIAELLALS